MYIPASREELNGWKFKEPVKKGDLTPDEQKEKLWNYINQDKYLRKHKGEYAKRGGAVMPWHHQVDLKLAQDFFMNVNGKRNMLQVGVKS